MKTIVPSLIAAVLVAACANPVAEQAARDTRHDPVRGDYMLAVSFAPGIGRLDVVQVHELRAMVASDRSAQRDEFVVVTSGIGGAMQTLRAQQVRATLYEAGARWVSTSLEPAMAVRPDQVVVVRSEYRIGEIGCPNYNPSSIGNPNESSMPGFGCGDAYNMGQMLARPRDAAIGREPGPAEAWVNADAVRRYREGRVRTVGAGAGGDSGVGGGLGGGFGSTGGAGGSLGGGSTGGAGAGIGSSSSTGASGAPGSM
jgi:type IV pilus biogenesis protein CpaD/CtpE